MTVTLCLSCSPDVGVHSIGGFRAPPLGRLWLSLPHLVSSCLEFYWQLLLHPQLRLSFRPLGHFFGYKPTTLAKGIFIFMKQQHQQRPFVYIFIRYRLQEGSVLSKSFALVERLPKIPSPECSTPMGERIYCHPQTDYFILSELFRVARHVGCSKPGSKPIQLYVRLSLDSKSFSMGIWNTYILYNIPYKTHDIILQTNADLLI